MDANDKNLLEMTLDYAAKTSEEAEILLYQNISTPVGFEAEKLKDIETREWEKHQWYNNVTDSHHSEETRELDVQTSTKELQNELKGAAGGKRLARMKNEGVSCPVLEKVIGFVQCFACSNFIRRVTGDVHCLGEPLT